MSLSKHEAQNYSPDTDNIIKYPSIKEEKRKGSDGKTIFLRMIHSQVRQHSSFPLPTTHEFIIHMILQYPSNLYLNVYKTARKGMTKSDRHMKPNAIFKTSKKIHSAHKTM